MREEGEEMTKGEEDERMTNRRAGQDDEHTADDRECFARWPMLEPLDDLLLMLRREHDVNESS